jgi:hypothetical protein
MRTILVALAGATLLAACNDPALGPFLGFAFAPVDSTFVIDASIPGPPPETPEAERLVGSLLYHARVSPRDTSLSSPLMGLESRVTVRNPADTAVALPFALCGLEAYGDPSREDRIWRSAGSFCAQTPDTIRLAPQDSAVYASDVDAQTLAEGFVDGRYYFTVQLRAATDTLALNAGSSDVRLRVPGLAFHVVAYRSDNHLMVWVTFVNRNSVPVHVQYGTCALAVSLFRDAAYSDFAAGWSSGRLCVDIGPTQLLLEPGAWHTSLEFNGSYAPSRLVKQGVDEGRHYLSSSLEVNRRPYVFPLGAMVIW